jgi:hypothetical protein
LVRLCFCFSVCTGRNYLFRPEKISRTGTYALFRPRLRQAFFLLSSADLSLPLLFFSSFLRFSFFLCFFSSFPACLVRTQLFLFYLYCFSQISTTHLLHFPNAFFNAFKFCTFVFYSLPLPWCLFRRITLYLLAKVARSYFQLGTIHY